MVVHLETNRLTLRPFTHSDLDAFAAINADPQVMRFFPAPQNRTHTLAMIERWEQRWHDVGYAFSAIELKHTERVVGMAGLSLFEAQVSFAPCTEIGWRLHPTVWGQGIASEAAREWLRFGFEDLDLQDIFAFAPKLNTGSIAVMERIGMQRDPDLDFEHPAIEQGHVLRPMSVSRITRSDWENQTP